MQHRQLAGRMGSRYSVLSRRMRKAWPAATLPAKCRTRSPSACLGCIGGSADLAPSTKTRLTFDGAGDFGADRITPDAISTSVSASTPWASILNGMALSKIRPYGSGFLIFSDYMRAPIRLSALMELPVIYIFTHDSIGVGEDGPTHQPVEQLISLRAIPGLIVHSPGRCQRSRRSLALDHGVPASSRSA